MLSIECKRKYRVYKNIADQVGELRIDTAKRELTEGIALSYLGEALLWLDQAKKEGFISRVEEEELRKAGLNDLIKGSATDVTKLTTGHVSEIENRLTELALEKLAECECGPGQELKEIQLKIPIEKSNIVESTLEKAGYDVGTDAYYADPDKYVTVIVRPTKELELRSGGRSYG